MVSFVASIGESDFLYPESELKNLKSELLETTSLRELRDFIVKGYNSEIYTKGSVDIYDDDEYCGSISFYLSMKETLAIIEDESFFSIFFFDGTPIERIEVVPY